VPELPLLTVLAENLERQVRGCTILDVRVRGVSVLKSVEPSIYDLRGARIAGVRRRGKYLLLGLHPELVLVFHLMRNGRLKLVPGGAAHPGGRAGRDVALVLSLDDGRDLQLFDMGPEKRASVWLFRRGEEDCGPLAGLGTEPLSEAFTIDALAAMVRDARTRLKPFLITQRHLVGIGNTYADEILWDARLSPQAVASRLRREEVDRLHAAVVSSLTRAIDRHRHALAGALPMKEPGAFLAVHRHGKEPCPRCGTPIAVIYYEGRETYYCPTCQTAGKVYADRRRSRLLR